MDGQKEYEQAVEILEHIDDKTSSIKEYEQALELLVGAHRLLYKQQEIFEILNDTLYKPNEALLRQRYAANLYKLGEKYSFLPAYDDLPFLVFRLNDEKYWIFYKEVQAFKANNWLIYHDYLVQRLLLEDEPDIEWLKREFATWENEEMAYVLYQEIDKELSEEKLSEHTVNKLAVYELLSAGSERSDLLYGRYYFLRQAYEQAEKAVQQGLRKRRFHFELNLLMGDLKMLRQDYCGAIYHYLLMAKIGRTRTPVDLRPRIKECVRAALLQDEAYVKKFQAACELSMVKPNLYPFVQKVSFNDEGNVQLGKVKFYEEPLEHGTGNIFYYNLYNERYAFDLFSVNKAALLEYTPNGVEQGGRFQFYVYRLLEGKKVSCYTAQQEGEIIPVGTLERKQDLEFVLDNVSDHIKVGSHEMQYFKLHKSMQIKSEQPFIVGRPMNVGHSPKRKRLIVNILVDALSFAYIKEQQYKAIPNIMKFFSEGVIFDQNYTPSEWTYPSFSAIQTGMRSDKTQIFHAQGVCQLDPAYKTIAEYLDEMGYLCVNTMDGIDQVFNGSCRGFRDSYHGYINRAYDAVERTISYIEAFKGNDLYINLHFDDVHVIYHKEYQIGIQTQTGIFADERCRLGDEKSVRAVANKVDTTNYEFALTTIDRILGNFFEFIKQKYNEDEYVICLYSDHGTPIFSNHIFALSQSASNAALMLRGGGVPKSGIVRDEVTSTIDMMAIFSKLLGFQYDAHFTDTELPKIFGGKGRAYTISQSIYPGQTYKMAINTLSHEIFIQSLEELTFDGRVNANRFLWQCHTKDETHEKCYDERVLQDFLRIYKENIRNLADADFEKIYAKG